jgi:hypothetical protein
MISAPAAVSACRIDDVAASARTARVVAEYAAWVPRRGRNLAKVACRCDSSAQRTTKAGKRRRNFMPVRSATTHVLYRLG